MVQGQVHTLGTDQDTLGKAGSGHLGAQGPWCPLPHWTFAPGPWAPDTSCRPKQDQHSQAVHDSASIPALRLPPVHLVQ